MYILVGSRVFRFRCWRPAAGREAEADAAAAVGLWRGRRRRPSHECGASEKISLCLVFLLHFCTSHHLHFLTSPPRLRNLQGKPQSKVVEGNKVPGWPSLSAPANGTVEAKRGDSPSGPTEAGPPEATKTVELLLSTGFLTKEGAGPQYFFFNNVT